LKEITDKLGTSCIEKARCYYEALELAHQAQVEIPNFIHHTIKV